jgi:hypothetical protein
MTFVRQKNVKIDWNSNFAYIIGVIASDGYITKDNSYVRFNLKDRELVENIKRGLGLKNKISYYSPKDRKVGWYSFEFGDRNFCEFLISIGIKNNKSTTIEKVKIPNMFFPDFCRGLFDGDGSFFSRWDKRRPSSFRFTITFASASKPFIFWLENELKKLYSLVGSVRRGDGVFRLAYEKKSTIKLFDIMYHSNNLLFLSRKHNKMMEAFEKDPNSYFKIIK